MARSPSAPSAPRRTHSLLLRPALALLPAAVGVLLCGVAAAAVFGADADRGDGHMVPLLAALALALGGGSAVRLGQLLMEAARWEGDGSEVGPPRSGATAADLHRIWLLGVGGSLALMGVLGLWSQADGGTSGLEPGWPLLLLGGVTALGGHLLAARVSARWQEHEQRWTQERRLEHERRMDDPLGRIREADARADRLRLSTTEVGAVSPVAATEAQEATATEAGHETAEVTAPDAPDTASQEPGAVAPADLTEASSDPRQAPDPSSAGSR